MAGFLKNLFDKKSKVEKVDVARRFELLARVGQGSMSKVWRARDAMNGRMLAVKVLDKMKTERFEARFIGLNKPSEGEISSSLQHPNIVRTIEHGITTTDEPYLVMEFVEGVSLSYLVDTQNDQMRDNCLNYIIQLGEAVDYLHKQNWIHRDLCPRNVMIDPDNAVKLIDFGLMVPNTPDFQKPGNRTGTANYMAPELIKRQRTDQRIDVYSFSVTAYEMYTKKLPWEVAAQETLDTVLQHMNKPPKPIQALVPDIDARVAEVIMKGLKSNPDDRWQSIAEMLIPLRKAHEDIEKKKLIERKRKAAAAAAKNKSAPAPVAAPKKKVEDEGDFFGELFLGEGQTKQNKPAAKSGSSPSARPVKAESDKRAGVDKSKTKPGAAAQSAANQAKAPLGKSAPASKSIAQKESDDDDEFDGIEIESSPEDEFDGIEIEVEGHASDDDEPVLQLMDDDETPAPVKSVKNSMAKAPAKIPAKSTVPVDDDEDEFDGIEIEVEGPDEPASKSKKSGK